MTTDKDEPPTLAPLDAMDTFRAQDRDPMRLWRVKTPKGVGGEVMAVLLHDPETRATSVVLVHEHASGKFTVYDRVYLDDL
jgi:hypothetical protein